MLYYVLPVNTENPWLLFINLKKDNIFLTKSLIYLFEIKNIKYDEIFIFYS